MNNEEKIAKEIETYRKLAEQDKKIDVASLMVQALEKKTSQNTLSGRQKRIAYLISLGLPPIGLIFALKFYFSDKDDGKESALVCVALTAFSFFITILLFRVIVSQSGVSFDQIQQINPQEIRELTE